MLVALTGLAGAGKTTAADILCRSRLCFERAAFADTLKHMLLAAGLDDAQLWGKLKETPDPAFFGRTPRELMQSLGMWGRGIHPDFWVQCMNSTLPPAAHIVIDDCRFANEAAWVRSRGGVVIQINRPGAGARVGADHPSEALEVVPDHIIDNRHCRTVLQHELFKIVGKLAHA